MAAQADCEWELVNGLSYDPEVDACVLDELAAERKGLLEKENAELEKQASQLAEEIKVYARYGLPLEEIKLVEGGAK